MFTYSYSPEKLPGSRSMEVSAPPNSWSYTEKYALYAPRASPSMPGRVGLCDMKTIRRKKWAVI